MRLLAIGAGSPVAAVVLFVLAASLAVAADLGPREPWLDWSTREVAATAPVAETLTLREIWRLDCGLDAEPLVGEITAAAPGLAGQVLLVDRQLVRALVVSPEGRVDRLVGRKGEGPGEVSNLYRTAVLADGRIGLVSGARSPGILIGGRGELVLLDPAGDPAGVWPVAGDPGTVPVSMVRDLRHAGPRLLVASLRNVVTPDTYGAVGDLALVATADGERTLLARHVFQMAMTSTDPITERDAFEPFAGGRCDLHASGRVAFAPERDRWLVSVREADGSGFNLLRRWSMPDRTPAQFEMAIRAIGCEREHACAHEPALGRLRWRPDGRLWVEPGGIPPQEGAIACFDELSADGVLLRRVQLVAPGAMPGDRLVVMEDGRFVLLHGFGDAATEAEDITPAAVLLEI